MLGLDRAFTINRLAERVDDAPEKSRPHRYLEDAAGGLDGVALAQVRVVAEHDGADRILLEVEREAEEVARELEHLAIACIGKAVDTADAIGHRNNRADVSRGGDVLEALDALLDEIADLGCLDGHVVRSS